tara:strand:+ start:2878 stop:3744 length:867 start_codon:yes stop_codon:yes gene_type:complete
VTLNSSLLSEVDKPFSSYIFTGNSPTQLEVQAKLFASKILFGSDTYSDHPDIRYIDSENLQTVGVQDVREVIESEAIRPVSADYKIYIFTPYKNLTEEALNALLKTLEDASSSTIYILLEANQFWTHELDDGITTIPETVKSRCRQIYISAEASITFDMSLGDFSSYIDLNINQSDLKKLYNLTTEILTPPKDIYQAANYAFRIKLESDNITKNLKEENITVSNQSILKSTLEYLSSSILNSSESVGKSEYRYSELLFNAIQEINRGMRPRVVLLNTFIQTFETRNNR